MRASDTPRRSRQLVWVTLALAVAAALLRLLAFPPYHFWPLAAIIPLPLAWIAWRAKTPGQVFLVVFAVHLVLWLWVQRWVIEVTSAGYPCLCIALALFPAIFVWIVQRTAHSALFHNWPMTIVVPIAWVAVEWFRARVFFHGYPWWMLGHPMVEWPVAAQSADLFGAPFVSFLTAMVSGAIVDVRRGMDRRSPLPLRRAGWLAGAVALLWCANIGYGVWRVNQTAHVTEPGPTLVLVQTNLPQDNKIGWTLEQQVQDLNQFIEQTEHAHEQATAEHGQVHLVVWPETMVPGYGLEPDTSRYLSNYSFTVNGSSHPANWYVDRLTALRDRLNTPLLLGSPVYLDLQFKADRTTWREHYNGVYLLEGEPPWPRYDKVVLTPFGEVIPYISAWPWLEDKLVALAARGMSLTLDSADSIRLLPLTTFDDRTIQLATPVCFEDSVSHLCRRMVYEGDRKVADVLVNLSNDGWFGENLAGRAQHVQTARFRCIENRVPMARCVNTGLSVGVDSAGRILGTIGSGRYGVMNTAGSLTVTLPLDERRTLYSRIGDLWAWLCLAAGGLGLIATWFGRTHET